MPAQTWKDETRQASWQHIENYKAAAFPCNGNFTPVLRALNGSRTIGSFAGVHRARMFSRASQIPSEPARHRGNGVAVRRAFSHPKALALRNQSANESAQAGHE